MGRKLSFCTPVDVKPLRFWQAVGRSTPALTYVLPKEEFENMAAKHGYTSYVGAFSVWGRWWEKDKIYLRHNRTDLFLHEWRHIETQSNFHEDEH